MVIVPVPVILRSGFTSVVAASELTSIKLLALISTLIGLAVFPLSIGFTYNAGLGTIVIEPKRVVNAVLSAASNVKPFVCEVPKTLNFFSVLSSTVSTPVNFILPEAITALLSSVNILISNEAVLHNLTSLIAVFNGASIARVYKYKVSKSLKWVFLKEEINFSVAAVVLQGVFKSL